MIDIIMFAMILNKGRTREDGLAQIVNEKKKERELRVKIDFDLGTFKILCFVDQKKKSFSKT